MPRLKPVALGEKAIGFFDDETDELVEALRHERDKNSPPHDGSTSVVLGGKIIGSLEDGIDQLVEALRRERDGNRPRRAEPTMQRQERRPI